MDTFAALALATDPATLALLDRKPDKKTAPLFSVDMYKQIIGQSTYQTIITLVFHFLGSQILGFHHVDDTTLQNKHDSIVQTLVFNIFVFAQIFNSINSRRLDNHLISSRVSPRILLHGITLIEVAVQVLIVFVVVRLSKSPGSVVASGIALALGFVSIPLGALIRCIPNGPVQRFFIKIRLMPNPNTFSQVRGGRMRASSYVGKARQALSLQSLVLLFHLS
ncbi:hypothetical protein A0H81_08042 [Grifola frondosa]|uniref:Cation-transporting P-type ATPase C-terminal domain-containing protein n=1 Tax=Grifola frondosa TaxID=5627 RepID=A0A1C7M5D1_GRIFR|nr:hypothetical protein A0H81_08042 [Grifola frondosa]